ncbi:MAG: MBL fold metallo-hydrolase [Acidobacteria bacterium]|nr:MBL fold metallo-hydrolase [Acidobacteriota bacterium]
MLFVKPLLVVLLAMLLVPAGASRPGEPCVLRITYLANEGFLLTAGDKKVVIDALFRNAMDPYLNHSSEVRKRLEKGEGEFAGVSVALATHQHADHFDAWAVADFLRNNPKALFAAHAGVTELVRQHSEATAKQLRSSSTEFRETLALNGIRVDVLRLYHNGRKPDLNVGYIVHLGGRKILHVGDSLDTVENFQRFELAREQIDVALLPYWYAMSEKGIRIIREEVKAAKVIFIHVPPGEMAEVRAVTSKHFPASQILERPLEEKCY